MANFVVIPLTLRDLVQIESTSHWQVYLGVLFASLFIMVPFMVFGERLKKIKGILYHQHNADHPLSGRARFLPHRPDIADLIYGFILWRL